MGPPVKMKARKPSKVVKPKIHKNHSVGTTKNHRFQSFNERITNLKIDPIRRRRNGETKEKLSDDTATYFGRALDDWRDLNLSKNFTAFAREAGSLCDSLPVVLHNEERIMDLLVTYIKQGDSLSLEPLFDLLSHFAHDLDIRFEKHFPRAVATITEVASSHSDPAVIEWSFTRLAWLFKYLSRVLTPGLRPLYDLMSSCLGKDIQKPFIIRFAAESMSFLIRKAAAMYDNDSRPLDLIVSHVFEDCIQETPSASNSLHVQGVMTMLTEAIKGVQREIHSSGLAVLRNVLNQSLNLSWDKLSALGELLAGILTCLIHHADVDGFRPIFQTILEYMDECTTSAYKDAIGIASNLVFVMVTVRKGSRIADWPRIMTTLRLLLDFGRHRNDLGPSIRQSVLSTVAASFQTATIDAVLPALGLLQVTRSQEWKPFFLPFCDLFSRLGRERFQQFLLPEFQKFIVEQWKESPDSILFYLPKLAPFERSLHFSETLQALLVERLSNLEKYTHAEDLSQRLVEASSALSTIQYVKLTDNVRERLSAALLLIVKGALQGHAPFTSDFENFALGSCFAALLDLEKQSAGFFKLWPLLCTQSSRYLQLPMFWINTLHYINIYRRKQQTVDLANTSVLESSILRALSLPSREIRQAALEVAQSLYELRNEPVPECLSTAIAIETTPISLETSRTISMNIRRLASTSAEGAGDSFTQKAIPSYCFGVLHLQLAQAWDDATETLAQLSKDPVCEEVIIALAQAWLEMGVEAQGPNYIETRDAVLNAASSGFYVDSEFECPNLAKLSALSQQTFSPDGGYPSKENELRSTIQPTPSISSNAREQALRVLRKIPSLAEKRSRMLVPVLLQWALSSENHEDEDTSKQRWARKDQKALLAIFSQFTNPRVLFKAAEVYAALLKLCSNGDAEIQRSALKAVFAWKDPAVNSYEEHLTNLLDEARFRDEISVFLQSGGEDAIISVDHQHKIMPVLLRLLYGRAVAGGKHGQSSRRKSIFVALSRYETDVLEMFVTIALGPLSGIRLIQHDKADEALYNQADMSLRQQFGMLNMLNDMLESQGSALDATGSNILDAVLVCSVAASRKLDAAVGSEENVSLLRSIRQVGLQCIVKVFASLDDSSYPIHAQVVLDELFVPRQAKFASENTQSVSAMLRFFSVLASSQQSGPYLSHHSEILLDRTAELLREPSAKDEVRIFILQEILDKLFANAAVSILTQEHVTSFVRSIGEVLKQQPSMGLVDACVESLSNLASWIEDDQDGQQVMEVCADLLKKPQKLVSRTTKAGLLKVLLPVLDIIKKSTPAVLYDSLHGSLCGLFSRLHDPETRSLLSQVFAEVCKSDADLLKSAQICEDLNSQGGRLDEPDHERRERGFGKVFAQSETFSARQWQPILQNCLFYLRDGSDIVNRTSSAQGLERLIDAASSNSQLRPLIVNVLLPGIEHGMRHESELVRAEFLRLLGHLVASIPDLPATGDLAALTISGDDEASVFSNILHIQQHRRLRALRRLIDEAGSIKSANTTKLFIPLLEHFVFDRAEGDAGRTLADQAILTIGALGKSLTWASFRATFKKYVGHLSSKPEQEAVTMRLLSALVDSIAPTAIADEVVVASTSRREEDIKRDLMPPLLDYIHLKDESTVDRRMPVAVTIVKLLLLLPKQDLDSKLAPVLTDVCQILRSHSQEARDQTRKTLAAILALVGPTYLGFILKELRGALKRGSQLHVLSFTVHSLLVGAVESYKPGDLDYCLPELATVIMDDIFGVTGQEKDSDDYRSKLKEVKSSKSFDTMEILARVTPMQKLARLVQPLRALLSESIDSKTLQKADDLLTRLRNGVQQNPAAQSRDALVFCYEIIRQVHQDQHQQQSSKQLADAVKHNRYIIQPEASHKAKRKGAVLIHSFKLTAFALNLLRRVLRRHDDLMTAVNLEGFLPVIGDALVQRQEEFQTSAIKMLSTIMKVDLPELEQNAPVYVKETVRIIKASSSLASDGPKAALDLLTAVLREKSTVAINPKDVAEVLTVLKVDIDEPDRQGPIYKFLRAILNRKILMTEVYEVMDDVGRVSVTNADRTVRESARSAFVHFIVEYPHAKDRWNKQATFLVENLKYEHASGRQSVMELLNQLLPKLPDEIVEQLSLTLFLALVPVQSSDSEYSCRQMASILIGKLFERVDSKQMDTFLSLIEKWASKTDSSAIRTAAFQCWRVALQKRRLSDSVLATVRSKIAHMLSDSHAGALDSNDELVQSAFDSLQVLIDVSPETAFAERARVMWQCLYTNLNVGSVSTRETVAKLVAESFSHVASSSSRSGAGLSNVPLQGSYGLELNSNEMRRICQSNFEVLLSAGQDLTEVLASQTVRNLVFLGRCFATNGMEWTAAEDGFHEEDNTDRAADTSAIAHLFSQLSYVTRQENLPLLPRISAIQCQIALIKHVEDIPNVVDLVKPLYVLTDSSVPKPNDEAYKTLADLARELLDAIQQKSGTESYVSALGEARSYAKSRREGRRQKRKISAVSAPEKWARAKKRKHEVQRSKGKANALVARGKRRGW